MGQGKNDRHHRGQDERREEGQP
jgi:hypothetical protein